MAATVSENEYVSGLDWLAAHGPQNDEEALDVAHALVRRREIAADIELLDALTPFERALADRAARAARDAVISSIERAIGHAAETLSASSLRHTLTHASARLDFGPSPAFGFGPAADRVRAAELVRGAHKQAEHAAQEPGRG